MSKRSSSIVLLTTSVVLAVAVFIFAYMVRPNDETDVLEKARERQSQSLLSVQQPLETDKNVLTKEEEMKNAVYNLLLNDEEFVSSISSQISSDEQFLNTIYNRVSLKLDSYLDEKVEGYVAEFTPQIEQYVDNLYQNEDPTIFIDELIEPVTVRIYNDLAAKITADIHAAFASDLTSAFEGAKGNIEDDIFNRVLAHLDTIAPDYVEKIKAEVSEQVESEVLDTVDSEIPKYEANLKAYIDEQVGLVIEDEALSLYEKYSDAIIADIVNEVLSRLDNVLISSDNADSLQSDATPSVAQEPSVRPISAPTFVSSKTERSISNEEYIKERAERRNAIINDIIQKLK